ncbi:MAG: class I SAM-dependent methyltransferase [Thermodesulfobacteriota bacterium]
MSDIRLGSGNLSQDRLWTYYQNESQASFAGAKPRIDFLLKKVVEKSRSGSIGLLNIGAGDGYLEETARRKRFDIHSLDPDPRTVERLVSKNIKASRGYMEQMPFMDEMFDFVIASEVLEHLEKDQFEKGLAEVHRVMKTGGWFIGTVPYREQLGANVVICPNCEEIFHRWGHKRSFGTGDIQRELERFFPDPHVKIRAFVAIKGRTMPGKLKSLIRLVLGRYGVAIAAPNIYFEARKMS